MVFFDFTLSRGYYGESFVCGVECRDRTVRRGGTINKQEGEETAMVNHKGICKAPVWQA